MRYFVLAPSSPFDPRGTEFPTLEAVLIAMPPEYGCETEEDAAAWIFQRYPDALVMPAPVKIGSGTSWMLGILENVSTPRDSDAQIPFVRFVRASAEIDRERKLVSSGKHWNAKIWHTPPASPTTRSTKVVKVEIRGTDVDHPAIVTGMYGETEDGRAVIRCTLNDITVSFTLNDKTVRITQRGD